MQRVLTARGEYAIHIDQILHAADFRAEDDLVGAQSVLLGQFRRSERAYDNRFHRDFAGVFRLGQQRVLVHHAREQCLIKRSPVHAYAYGLLVLHGNLDHGAEVVVVLAPDAGVAGIDAVLGQALGAARVFRQQKVSVVMEIADDGHTQALLLKSFDDLGDGLGSIVIVDGDADDFAAGTRQGGDLLYGARDVRGVGVGHRLHHDRCIAAYSDAADGGGNGFSTLNFCHIRSYILAGYSQKIAPVERTAGTERRNDRIPLGAGQVFPQAVLVIHAA